MKRKLILMSLLFAVSLTTPVFAADIDEIVVEEIVADEIMSEAISDTEEMDVEILEATTPIVEGDFLVENGNKITGLSDAGKAKSVITIPSNIRYIADNAFKNATNLTSVTIENSDINKINIGDYAFKGCSSLSTLDIRSKIIETRGMTGYSIFGGCNISTLTLSPEIEEIPAVLFNGAGFNNYDLHIPASVKKIGKYAFYGAQGINSLTFDGNNVTEIDDWAFRNLNNIAVVDIPASRTGTIYLGDNAFNGCSSLVTLKIGSRTITTRGMTGYPIFGGCNISTLTLSPEIEEIPTSLFNGAKFNNYDLHIPASVKKIGKYAFYGAQGINSITFDGSNVTEIGAWAFQNLVNITSIDIPASRTGTIYLGDNAFNGCSSLVTLKIGSRTITTRGMTGYPIFGGCNISTLTLSPEIEEIPAVLFNGAGFNNYDMHIPASVKKIGKYAFYGAQGINSLTFDGNNVTEIGDSAFRDLIDIPELTLSSSVASIGDNAFAGEKSLLKITIGNSVGYEKIGKNVFYTNLSIDTEVNTSNSLFLAYDWKKDNRNVTIATYDDGKPDASKMRGITDDKITIGNSEAKVTFNLDGGTAETLYTNNGKKVVLLNPTKEGYTFKGWYNGNKKVKSLNEKYLRSNKVLVLVAKWVENKYSIKFKLTKPATGVKITGKPKTMKITYEAEVVIPGNVVATDKFGNTYEVTAWTGSDGKTYKPGDKVNRLAGKTKKDKKFTLTAYWEISKK